MLKNKVSIKFSSIANLWAFRNVIGINSFHVDIAHAVITFENDSLPELGWAVEKYEGQIISNMEKA